jgi:hypothetical protein
LSGSAWESQALAARWIRERRYHAVIGDRTLPGSDYVQPGPVRAVLSSMASFVFRTLVTGGIYDTQCGLKVFRGDVAAVHVRGGLNHGSARRQQPHQRGQECVWLVDVLDHVGADDAVEAGVGRQGLDAAGQDVQAALPG